jgi:hypothetical protein
VSRRGVPAVVVLGALLLCAALALPACDRIGTAGASTTAEAIPPTTSSTPETVPAADQQQQKLEQARSLAQAGQTGIKLFLSTPLVDRYTNESQLILRGTVTKVDKPRVALGDVANPYMVFYVEPSEVLKGTPRFGSPVAFALLAPGEGATGASAGGAAESPVSEGDDVLLFAYGTDKDLLTASGSQGAYFPWNDSYGIFLPAGDKFVNVLAPFAYTTLEEVRTIVGPKETSTTNPPGYSSFNGRTYVFEDRLQGKRLPGTLPLEVLPAAELDWLQQTIAPLETIAAKGYRLANGDLVFLWSNPLPGTVQERDKEEPALLKRLKAAATERFGASGNHVSHRWFDEFGWVVVARDYVDQLGTLADMAETGAPLYPNPAPGG